MKKAYIYLLSCFLATLLLYFPGILRSISVRYDFFVSYAAYFLTLLLLFKKYPSQKLPITNLFIASVVLNIAPHSIYIGKVPSAIINLTGIIIACVAAYWYATTQRKAYRQGIVVFSVVICVFCFFWGIPYYTNYRNFGNITGRIDKPSPMPKLYFMEDDSIDTGSSKDKVVVLNFYNNYCSICFTEFPEVQKIYNKYKSNLNFKLFAVNIPWMGENKDSVLQRFNENGYSFPAIADTHKLDSIFGVTAYPTIIILRNNTIKYKGGIDNATRVLEELLGSGK